MKGRRKTWGTKWGIVRERYVSKVIKYGYCQKCGERMERDKLVNGTFKGFENILVCQRCQKHQKAYQ